MPLLIGVRSAQRDAEADLIIVELTNGQWLRSIRAVSSG
jgi:hypothetical protein